MSLTDSPFFKRAAAGVLAITASFALAACGTVSVASGTTATSVTTTTASSVSSSTVASLSDNVVSHAEADDADYDTADANAISLADGASKAATKSGVSISGDVITITAPGTYILSGTLTNGQVVVTSDAEGKVRIVLDNASITNSAGAAVVVTAADEAVVVLAEGTTNSITDGSGYDTSATDAPNAALFSMADLTIAGTGKLTVTGNTGDGIASKDGLVILAGDLTVKAVDDGIRGKDYVLVEGGTVSVESGADGLKSNNETDDTVGYVVVNAGSVTINAGDDGVHAEGDLAITGGEVTIAKANEGLEGASITIAGGATSVTSSDDGLNASNGTATATTNRGPGGGGMADDGSELTISGGTLLVNADGDGLDSNGSLAITGGTTVVSGPTMNGNGSLDANAGITITGGVVVAAGSAGMLESPDSASTVGWVSATTNVSAGQTVSIVSGDTVIASYTAVKNVANILVADSDIVSGQSYDVYVGGKLAGTSVGTYSDSGTISGATKATSVTAGVAAAGGGMRR